ncbi:MAG: hypothetical protein KCHDKBKB_02662 [Elusimicrobia bacterium]|nr:hypothetical protein [Elusimicrobiota bacterium]
MPFRFRLRRLHILLFLFFLFISHFFLWASGKDLFSPPQKMTVISEVADIRSKPQRGGKKYIFDPLQETQVLKGEQVLVFEKKGKWFRVECPEQQEFTHENKWQGYPGWIEKKFLTPAIAVSENTSRPAIPFTDELRPSILKEARRHLGSPYLWGGRSLHNPQHKQTLTGVDCSGLVNWSYRQAGLIVPRDAHEQWMKSQPIEPRELEPADLIFLAKTDNPEKVVHVMIYAGNGKIIEAPQSGDKVRELFFDERLGKFLIETKSGEILKDRVIYFGTFFQRNHP